MRKSRKICVIVFLALILCAGCTRKENAITPVSNRETPDQEMWNFDVKVTNKGKLEAHLKAGHMLFFSAQNQSFLNEGVLVDFFDNEGKTVSTLTSDSGMFNDKVQNVKAIKNVVVESDSGVTLYTEELSFDQNREKIFTDKAVKITTTQGDTFHGIGFESDPQLKFWKINKFHGIAHRGFDLSTEQLKKTQKDSSVDAPAPPDSLAAPDTMAVKHGAIK